MEGRRPFFKNLQRHSLETWADLYERSRHLSTISLSAGCVNEEEEAVYPEPESLCSTCPLSTPRPKTLEYENQVSIFGPARRRRRRSRARCFR